MRDDHREAWRIILQIYVDYKDAETIKNLLLTCKTFNKLVTPHLHRCLIFKQIENNHTRKRFRIKEYYINTKGNIVGQYLEKNSLGKIMSMQTYDDGVLHGPFFRVERKTESVVYGTYVNGKKNGLFFKLVNSNWVRPNARNLLHGWKNGKRNPELQEKIHEYLTKNNIMLECMTEETFRIMEEDMKEAGII